MGAAKQSLRFEGATLLSRAVTTALASRCRPIVVVLGAAAEEFGRALENQPVTIAVNANWQLGIGGSIRAGAAAIQAAAPDAVMIFLCDQPLISSTVLNQLVEAHFVSDKLITAAFYANEPGTPAIFSSSLLAELMALPDSRGGKWIMHRHPDQLQTVAVPEAEMDIDTVEDFKRLTGGKP
jgi:molybdenum cofactor cytidylyltransferase